jgi:hypothetical protein
VSTLTIAFDDGTVLRDADTLEHIHRVTAHDHGESPGMPGSVP